MRSILQNKKAQMDFPIITLAVILIGLLFLAPFIIKIIITPLDKFSSAVGNQSVEAGQAVTHIESKFTGLWDTVIVIAFLVNIILLFVTAFLVDVHPAFLVIYILLCFFTMFFAPTMLDALNAIWESPQFITETTYLPFTQFILNNFGIIILSVIILSGVIMYAKFKFKGSP